MELRITQLEQNSGQIAGLPANPRQWTKADVERLAKSIEETPELLEARPLIVVPLGKTFVVLGGNLRLAALKHLGRKTAPVYVLPEDTPIDKQKEIVIKDNGSFGSWDWDMLANEWDSLPLNDWGLPSWTEGAISPIDLEQMGISPVAKGGESESGYSSISFLFTNDDAELVKGWIDANSKEDLVNKIVEICRNAEAK